MEIFPLDGMLLAGLFTGKSSKGEESRLASKNTRHDRRFLGGSRYVALYYRCEKNKKRLNSNFFEKNV
jgi:hypothetical protein